MRRWVGKTPGILSGSERRAKIVLCELRLRDRNLGAQLIGRNVEDRDAERVVDRSLIRTLRTPGAAAENEVAASAAWATAPRTAAGRAAAAPSECAVTGPAAAIAEGDSPPSAPKQHKMTPLGDELAERDRVESIVEQPAVEIGGIAGACDRDRVGLRRLDGESWRKQPRDVLGRCRHRGLERSGRGRASLNVQRLEALSGLSLRASCRGLGVRAGGWSLARRAPWLERELKIDGLITGRRCDLDGSFVAGNPARSAASR